MSSKKLVQLALFLAIGIILSYVESLIPLTFLFPGAKLGLANVVGLIVLAKMNERYYIGYNILRVVLVALLFSGFGVNFFISLGGATLATLTSLFIHKFSKASIFGISIGGATMHGLGQCIVVAIIYQSGIMINYVLFMSIASFITGIIVATLAALIIPKIKLLG